jgi:hypothetical protein
VAQAYRIRLVLWWVPRLENLDQIVRSMLDWVRRLQRAPKLHRN